MFLKAWLSPWLWGDIRKLLHTWRGTDAFRWLIYLLICALPLLLSALWSQDMSRLCRGISSPLHGIAWLPVTGLPADLCGLMKAATIPPNRDRGQLGKGFRLTSELLWLSCCWYQCLLQSLCSWAWVQPMDGIADLFQETIAKVFRDKADFSILSWK